jgi:hypothetical protein
MFQLVRADADRGPADDEPYLRTLTSPADLLVQGETLSLFRSLQRRLAGSTRHGGVSSAEAQRLLLGAAGLALDGSDTEAARWLDDEVESPLDEWLVVVQLESLYLPVRRLSVGRSTYFLDSPRRLRSKSTMALLEMGDFKPPFVATTVSARDDKAAHVIASERFAESGAILDLLDRPKGTGGAYYAQRNDRSGKFSFTRSGWILNDWWIEANGRLRAPYRQLSRAATKEEVQRSDWERRTLAATRWFSRSLRSPWPADRLVSLMIALESLFAEGPNVIAKGRTVAAGVSGRFVRRELTVADQEAWLADLYRRRNAAVHEGREYEDELEVELLTDLAYVATRWAAHHLDPAHRSSGRSCRTFTAAMRCTG